MSYTERDNLIIDAKQFAEKNSKLSGYGAETFGRWIIAHCETHNTPVEDWKTIASKWLDRFEKHEHLLRMDKYARNEYIKVITQPWKGTARNIYAEQIREALR